MLTHVKTRADGYEKMSYILFVVEAGVCLGLHWSEDREQAKDRLNRRREGKKSAEDRQQCSSSRQLYARHAYYSLRHTSRLTGML